MVIPKSLHTVTAVRNIARYVQFMAPLPYASADDLVDESLEILGYGDTSVTDQHGLRAKCITAVQKDLNNEEQ